MLEIIAITLNQKYKYPDQPRAHNDSDSVLTLLSNWTPPPEYALSGIIEISRSKENSAVVAISLARYKKIVGELLPDSSTARKMILKLPDLLPFEEAKIKVLMFLELIREELELR